MTTRSNSRRRAAVAVAPQEPETSGGDAARAFHQSTDDRGSALQPFDKFVVIDEMEYDITSFAKRHPGGNVLMSYEGQDGTAAYKEFHSNSTKAKAVLSKLPRRPARSPLMEPNEARIMQEFAEWRNSLADRGFFKVSGAFNYQQTKRDDSSPLHPPIPGLQAACCPEAP